MRCKFKACDYAKQVIQYTHSTLNIVYLELNIFKDFYTVKKYDSFK